MQQIIYRLTDIGWFNETEIRSPTVYFLGGVRGWMVAPIGRSNNTSIYCRSLPKVAIEDFNVAPEQR